MLSEVEIIHDLDKFDKLAERDNLVETEHVASSVTCNASKIATKNREGFPIADDHEWGVK